MRRSDMYICEGGGLDQLRRTFALTAEECQITHQRALKRGKVVAVSTKMMNKVSDRALGKSWLYDSLHEAHSTVDEAPTDAGG